MIGSPKMSPRNDYEMDDLETYLIYNPPPRRILSLHNLLKTETKSDRSLICTNSLVFWGIEERLDDDVSNFGWANETGLQTPGRMYA